MITVKVVQLPGQIREVALEPGATVRAALTAAGISSTSGKVLKVNGADATESTVLSADATVMVTAKITGNR